MTATTPPTRPALASRVDPRLQLLDRLLSVTETPVADMTLADIRRERADETPDHVLGRVVFGAPARDLTVTDVQVQHAGGPTPARIYRPRGPAPLPVVVFFHGGGWVLGNVRRSLWLCSQVAAQVGAVVCSMGYRLAPEHPFPAATDDAWDGLRWVVDHVAEHGGDASRLAVMGSSAGGNLAAVVAQRARAEGGPSLRHQVLIYPATDATLASRSMATVAGAPMLTTDDMRAFYSHYAAHVPDPSDPRLSPLHADSLAGLPPALVITASHDPLRDEGWRYAEKLRADGTPARYTEYVGMTHGFLSYPGVVGAARQALAEIVQELHRSLTVAAA